MKISIVTPSFNQGGFIEEAIQSVATQKHVAFEHIIVDNLSQDTTSEVLSRYSDLRVIRQKDNGQSDAFNKGVKTASGDIIGWLNADDRYAPGCFEKVVDFFKKNPDCDILYGDYCLIDQGGHLLKLRKEIPFDLFMFKYLHVLCIPSTTTFLNRKIFDQDNFLDTSYHYSMDYEFFLRLANKKYKFFYIPALLADFRVHTESKSSRQQALQKTEMEKALLSQDEFLSRFKSPIRDVIRNVLMVLARAKRYALKLMRGAYL